MCAPAIACLPSTKDSCAHVVAGGVLSVVYDGNALDTMAKVKEQIMLNGGVMTSMAMSNRAFDDFVKNVTSANGPFGAAEDLTLAAPEGVSMHAAFCYG
jgi:hypothetical protein